MFIRNAGEGAAQFNFCWKDWGVSFLLEHVVKQSLGFKNFRNSGEMITKFNEILVNFLSKNTVGIISAL